jgi:ATP-binding cassette, subfamily D (ALD), member 3
MGVFDSMLVKYGAVMVAYGVLGIPVFGSKKDEYLKDVSSDTSSITRDYIRNSSLLISLAKAIGRIVVSYKEVQNLAGYTTLVYELKEVIDDLKYGSYARIMSNKDDNVKSTQVEVSRDHLHPLNQGEIIIDNNQIKLMNVPLDAPNGDKLAKDITCVVRFTDY